jgi:hypothetical protein
MPWHFTHGRENPWIAHIPRRDLFGHHPAPVRQEGILKR